MMTINTKDTFATDVTVIQTATDLRPVPDFYSTGPEIPDNEMVKITDGYLPCTIDGVETTLDAAYSEDSLVVNLKYKHKELSGDIVFENLDLSSYSFRVYGLDNLKETGRQISFTFQNCKLEKFTGERKSYEGIRFEFNHCSFLMATGSDVTFNYCRFGGGAHDRMNLFVNCFVNDCYIYNPTCEIAESGVIHVDGIQIFGNNTDSSVKTENIHFDNCHFEMPAVKYPNAPKAYVNACIMVQTEYSDGDNISFENCYLNGGGYTVYVHGVKGTKLTNVTLKNLTFGGASVYGWLYPDKPKTDQVNWNEDTWKDADQLYIGTIQRDQQANTTTLCVTNDTKQNRYFRVYTSNGTSYDYEIEACPLASEFRGSEMTFEQFPIDRLITVPEYCDWLVVFEKLPTSNSTEATMKQIRFANWTNEESITIPEVSSKSMSYSLNEGTLTVTGFGDMPEFDADSLPWKDELGVIQKVVLEGFTSISKDAFAGCSQLREVSLGDTVKTIHEGAFADCVLLSKITLSAGLKKIEKDAFSVNKETNPEYNLQRDVFFRGSLKQYLNLSMENENANPMYAAGGNLYVETDTLVESVDYASLEQKKAGAYLFAGCKSLKTIKLDGVTEIGIRAFAHSGIMGALVIPSDAEKVGTYTFSNCDQITQVTWNSPADLVMGCFQNNKSLESLTITTQITALRNWCLKDCPNLKEFEIPKSVTSIAQSTLQGCSSLEELCIPAGVTDIGNFVFANCTGLKKLTFEGETCPTISKTAFNKIPAGQLSIYVPENATGYSENERLTAVATEFVKVKAPEKSEDGTGENSHGEEKPSAKPSETVEPGDSNNPSGEEKPSAKPSETVEPGDNNNSSATEQPGVGQSDPQQSDAQNTVLKRIAIKTIKNKKGKKIYLTWKKGTKVSGYQIQYSTSKNFKKNVRTKKIKKASQTKATISKLTKGKKYYVRIRSYKKVGKKLVVSKWSKRKSVKIKR